jgi:hypothetical protein
MNKLIEANGNNVTKQEAAAYDPNLGPCCDITNFRVHLEGTPCDAWNKSAMDVFVIAFLAVHPEYLSRDDSVREMVKMKSHAALESTIKKYRKSKVLLTDGQVNELRLQKNRQERKRKECFSVLLLPTGGDRFFSSLIAAALSHPSIRLSIATSHSLTNSRLLECLATKSE